MNNLAHSPAMPHIRLGDAIETATYGNTREIFKLPQIKAKIDAEFLNHFQSSDLSAEHLCHKLSLRYRTLLSEAIEQSGLSSEICANGFTLAAIGGFARGQSSIHSDWDAALIHQNSEAQISHPAFTDFIDLMRYGIEVKFALRSPDFFDENLLYRNRHGIMSFTALLEMDFICGNSEKFSHFEIARDSFIKAHFSRLLTLLTESIIEREKKNGTLFKLAEFDLKESRGGLRDLDCITWLNQMARIAGHPPLLSEHEQSVIDSAKEILLRAKHSLHIANSGDRTGSFNSWNNKRRTQLLELFKRDSGDLLPPRVIYDVLYSTSQQTAAILNSMIERCQSYTSELSPHVPKFSRSSEAKQEVTNTAELGELLKRGATSVSQIRQLYESGQLTKIVPEFGYAEFFVDQAGFHRFPLGEHQVRTAEELSNLISCIVDGRITDLGFPPPLDTAPLFLASLLHDIAKPDEGPERDHPVRGANIAFSVATRLGFSPEQAEKTKKLICDHMLIADIAGRSELALTTAEAVSRLPSLGYLQELLLFTLADKKESNPFNWTASRRDQVLGAYQQLKIALGNSQDYRENLCDAVGETLHKQDTPCSPESIRSFIGEIASDVLGFYSTQILAEKITLFTDARERPENGEPVFRAKVILPNPSESRLQLFFVSPDSEGLLARVSMFLSQRRMALRSALVDTRDGLACDYLSIQLPENLQLNSDDLARFIMGLNRAVTGTNSIPSLSYSPNSGRNALESASLDNPLTITVKQTPSDRHLALTIVDCLGREVFPIISPVLEHFNLSVENAQIGCGNRSFRHYFELRSRSEDSFSLNELRQTLEEAYNK